MPTPDTSELSPTPLRWGFVGTGTIAGWMASVLETTPSGRLVGVASRRMDTAKSFAAEHGAERAFDSWEEMLAWGGIDAVYVATPTALREAICVAAAKAGKHVLGEKPFASLTSLQRITAACRENEVGFMDATHFVHHPRYATLRHVMAETIGRPQSLTTAFLVSLTDRGDIRYDPALEPLGAIGDLGWYNVRATLEYLSAETEIRSITSRLRRDAETGAIIAGEGSITFDDERVSEWRCGFDAEALDIGLELAGTDGAIRMANFVGEDEDRSAGYSIGATDGGGHTAQTIRVDSALSGPALMFEDFARMAWDASLHPQWARASERTQALLDAVMAAGDQTPLIVR